MGDTTTKRREKTMARGRKRKIFDKGEKVCTPPGCVTTERERTSTLGREKEGINVEEIEIELQHHGEKKKFQRMRKKASTPRKERGSIEGKEKERWLGGKKKVRQRGERESDD